MKKAIEYFVRFPILSNLLTIFVVFLGIYSAFHMRKSFFPNQRVKDIYVTVAYPGASPEEMEEGITLKVEEAIKAVPGIEEIRSTSSENSANIHIEAIKGYDIDEVLTDIENSVNTINSFPENAEKPKVYKQKPVDACVYFSLYGDVDLMELRERAKKVEDDLLSTGFISQVDVFGYPELEFSIEVNENTLHRYSLTIDEITEAIRRNNRDLSGGSIKTSDEEILIRSRNKKTTAYDIGKIVVRAQPDGRLVRVEDVSTIKFQFADTPNKTLLNGRPSVSIQVNQLPEEDILEIVNFCRAYADTYNEENETTKITITRDRSISLKQRIYLLLENGFVGLILVIVVLSLFLNTRLSFWVAMGIPISFLGMMYIVHLFDITINQISLFGMILVIGILVDDGIVIAENIHSHTEKGKTPIRATVDGTMEVLPSVFTSVMTTIFAFASFFFLDSRIGEFMSDMAAVVVACLAFSLIEATFILSTHLSHSKQKEKEHKIRAGLNKGINFVRTNIYGKALSWLLKYRWITLSLGFFIWMLITGLISSGKFVRFGMMPNIESDHIFINLDLKPGTREFTTEEYLHMIDQKIWEVNDEMNAERNDNHQIVQTSMIMLGRSETDNGSHTGRIMVHILDGEIRSDMGITNAMVSERIRKAVGPIPQADRFTVGSRNFFGKPVSITLLGKKPEELDLAADELKAGLEKISELKEVIDNNAIGKREITLKPKAKAYALGLDHYEISRQVRQGFFGQEAQRLQIGSDEVKVWVRYPLEDREKRGNLDNMFIQAQGGGLYPLREICDYSIERGVVGIKHMDGAREITIEAEQKDPNSDLTPIQANIDTLLKQIFVKYPSVKEAPSGQAKENAKMVASVGKVAPILAISIILILALTFRSYTQWWMILAMIPLAILSTFIGHWIHDKTFVMMSWFGCLALSGVVINDSVVFLDKYNQNLKEGMTAYEAAFNAGTSRFRAIVLTSITTVAGLFPIIFEKSLQAQFLIPMAISVAYGVLFGTFFILTLFPAIILIYNDIRRIIDYGWEGKWPTAEEVEPAVRELKKLNSEK